ncbi:uncharacterized N-acetyltransferase p20-like [Mangifera indica]|uniref:uncharacterized N-acetyltransferase p20-like n=1 Tax=Mangifera indica TaxID=29780 RepID=UPI001CFB6A64|nr:uncharacterized N-acetyltransferase p20-like [Mangifera indica]
MEGPVEFWEISLRPLELSDIDDFMVWARDDKVTSFTSYGPFSRKEEGIEYINEVVRPHEWFKAICINNRPIGAISVTPFADSARCRGEIGYVLGSKYWGKGIATRAVKMVVNMIFDEWPHLERLEALVDVENVGSQKVLQKAGFMREGVLRKYCIMKGKTRDMVMFSLLSTDPRI